MESSAKQNGWIDEMTWLKDPRKAKKKNTKDNTEE